MPVPMHPGFPRRHAAPSGHIYTVEVAPVEGARGVESHARALVFTRELDGAVLTVRVPISTDPRWLTASDLDELLGRAW